MKKILLSLCVIVGFSTLTVASDINYQQGGEGTTSYNFQMADGSAPQGVIYSAISGESNAWSQTLSWDNGHEPETFQPMSWGIGNCVSDKYGYIIGYGMVWSDFGPSGDAGYIINNGQNAVVHFSDISINWSWEAKTTSDIFELTNVTTSGYTPAFYGNNDFEVHFILAYKNNDAIAINNNSKYIVIPSGVYLQNQSTWGMIPISDVKYFVPQNPLTALVNGVSQTFSNLAAAEAAEPLGVLGQVEINLPSGYTLQTISGVLNSTNYTIPSGNGSTSNWVIGGILTSPSGVKVGTVVINPSNYSVPITEQAQQKQFAILSNNENTVDANWSEQNGYQFNVNLLSTSTNYDSRTAIFQIQVTSAPQTISSVRLNVLDAQGESLNFTVEQDFGADMTASSDYTFPQHLNSGWGFGGNIMVNGSNVGLVAISTPDWLGSPMNGQMNNKVKLENTFGLNLITSYTPNSGYDFSVDSVSDIAGTLNVNIILTKMPTEAIEPNIKALEFTATSGASLSVSTGTNITINATNSVTILNTDFGLTVLCNFENGGAYYQNVINFSTNSSKLTRSSQISNIVVNGTKIYYQGTHTTNVSVVGVTNTGTVNLSIASSL